MHTWSGEERGLAQGAQEGARSTATGAASGEEQVRDCDSEMIQVHTPKYALRRAYLVKLWVDCGCGTATVERASTMGAMAPRKGGRASSTMPLKHPAI